MSQGLPLQLEVSVQSSRFHDSATDGITLRGMCITVGGEAIPGAGADATAKRDLLVDADLTLSNGTCYALVGRNGTGKSILLKVLASGALFDPDAQLSLRIQLVSQSFAPTAHDWTVLQEVNTVPFGYDLSEALDGRKRAERRSQLRSGKRGKEARQHAVRAAAAAGAAAGRSVTASDDDLDGDSIGDDDGRHEGCTSNAASYMTLVADDGDKPPNMAAVVSAFKQVGIPVAMLEQPYETLSGGWRMRVVLAKALIYQPNILLLDEPTNHLDIGGINHLISLMKSEAFADTTIILVSHDLYVVNELAQSVIHLQDCKLTVQKGNWETLQRERQDRKKFTDRYAEVQEKERERLLASIDASMRKAGKDDKLRKQLAARREKVEERGSGLMRDSKGHRYRKNDDENAGFHLTLLREVEVIRDERPVHFRFDTPTLGRAAGGSISSVPTRAQGGELDVADMPRSYVTLLSIDDLAFSYSGKLPPVAAAAPVSTAKGASKKGPGAALPRSTATTTSSCTSSASSAGKENRNFVLELKDLNVACGERVVLLGPNGHGKSTLMRLITGELTPGRGCCTIQAPAVGYFEQHSVTRLGGEKRQVLQYVVQTRLTYGCSCGSGDEEEAAARALLGSFGLGPCLSTPVCLLSGGQRVALEFVLIALRRPALLLLDEPSAHLDLQAREGLAAALSSYTLGAVVFISHDIGFIDLCQPTRALLCRDGKFVHVPKDKWKAIATSL